MGDALNTLADALYGRGPVTKEQFVGTPFGALYRGDLYGFGSLWNVYHSCASWCSPSHRESTLREGIAAFHVALDDRLTWIAQQLAIFKEQRGLKLRAQGCDEWRLRVALEEMAQVSLFCKVMTERGCDFGQLETQFNELRLLFQNEVDSSHFRVIPENRLATLFECWDEYNAYSWVRKLMHEGGVLPVSTLRLLVEGREDAEKDARKFVAKINKAYDEGRLSLTVVHRALIMVVEEMDSVPAEERGYALGKLECALEDMGCAIFRAKESGREGWARAQESFYCNGTEYWAQGQPISDGQYILIPLQGDEGYLVQFSLENQARLCMDQARLRKDGDDWGGLTLLLPEKLDQSGSCAIVRGNPRRLVGSRFNEESLLNQLKILARREKMPAGRLEELLCVQADGSVAWRLQSDGDQDVSAMAIEELLNLVDASLVHDWMMVSQLGARAEAKRERERIFGQLQKKEGPLWHAIQPRCADLCRDLYGGEVTFEAISTKFQEKLVPEWLNANGVIAHFSKAFLDGVQAKVTVEIDDQRQAQSRSASRPHSGDSVPTTPRKVRPASQRFGGLPVNVNPSGSQ